ncbi:YciI family protein [Krasilnikovia sp. M28-CT-15]|uniref:YciI family protein n=1 Tax=Krasilnikovia sp. M28-CT-15 TaxID=3373540 RepID=UPI003876637E
MISTYLAPLDEIDQARADHLAFLGELSEAGVLVSAGRQDPPDGGVVLLDAATAQQARDLMADDPYVRRGLARYEPVGWRPTVGVLADWTSGQATPRD